MKNRNLLSVIWLAGFVALSLAPGARAQAPSQAQAKGTVVEEIVARVNNQIITLSDYQKAAQALARGGRAGLPELPAGPDAGEYKERQKNLLRDLIDQQLLIERAKDMDISVETD